jgi:uncharacterized heparinase superfamily protein
MSVGKERLVVNCGAYSGDNDDWLIAQRTTAAHSAMTVGNINSSELLPGGAIGNRPKSVAADRRDTDGNIWIDSSHDGYQTLLGLTHSRRIYLAANGGDVRGEDTLSGKGEHKFTVRFHLHPSVSASLVQDGGSVLMRLPSGAGWRFRSSGGVVSMQESVYLGVRGEIKRGEQIVVSGATQNGGAQVKWAFSRMSK